jgi:hypothetical protein
MKYAVEMGSGTVTYVHTEFHKGGFGHTGHIQTQRQADSMVISLAYFFFQKNESRLKVFGNS